MRERAAGASLALHRLERGCGPFLKGQGKDQSEGAARKVPLCCVLPTSVSVLRFEALARTPVPTSAPETEASSRGPKDHL